MEQRKEQIKVGNKVHEFISSNDVGDRKDNGLGGLGGWFQNGHTWQDYENQFTDEGKVLVRELRDKIISHGIACTGEQMDSGARCIPLWDDNTVTGYSWRAWGDLMAAVHNFIDGKPHNYMEFYM